MILVGMANFQTIIYSFFVVSLFLYRASAEKRILLSDPNYVIHIESALAELTAKVYALQTKFSTQQDDLDNLETTLPVTVSGATFVRWGRTTCPGNGTELAYEGVAAGALYTDTGGAVEYVCMPNNPVHEFTDYVDNDAHMYGALYESKVFSSTNTGDRAPCAVCHATTRASQLMVPGRNACPSGWTLEYHGILSSGYRGHKAGTQYICLDAAAQSLASFSSNAVGKLLYRVRGKCSSLPCPPYLDGRLLSCAVCTK
ncbi:short-chain collagen C4-like [Pecten maximus]|uniref:short-chain collagen C4-like n=1 Tax=Pecten maximus TaxID=6579 RepID=UPI0014588D90|nr:short-chain collagen C4-like [Pecten maximus]